MSDELFDLEPTNCDACGRRLHQGVCVWCAANKAPTLVRRDAMDTSVKAAAKASKTSTKQRIVALLLSNERGLTDMQIEDLTGLTHQSASAARRGLVVAGLVEDSGERRKNSRGNDAAVWRLVSPNRKEPDVRKPDPRPEPAYRPHGDGLPNANSCINCGGISTHDYNCPEWDR